MARHRVEKLTSNPSQNGKETTVHRYLVSTTLSSKCPDTTQDQVLCGVKIIDLTSPAGFYCSKLLADLGADVIRIEDSSTAEIENYGPFYESKKHIDNSLYRWHFHTNKRSVELNLSSKNGEEIFLDLLGVADVLITTEPESKIAHLKIGKSEIRAKHPKLIHTSIRAFSSQSIYSKYKATDIVALAMSGLMAITGFPEDPPNQMGGEQAYHMTSMHAATGTLIALLNRDFTGLGKDVEVSMQECTSLATLQTANLNYYTWQNVSRERTGLNHPFSVPRSDESSSNYPRTLYQCKDGWVSYSAHLAPPGAWERFLKWLEDHDSQQDLMDSKYLDPETRQSNQTHIDEVMANHCLKLPAQELYHSAQRYRLLCVPVQDIGDLFIDEQLNERSFFTRVKHEDRSNSFTYPGAPYKLSETPWRIQNSAPKIGQHTEEVLEEWLHNHAGDVFTTDA
ncbi:MAG TPA: hypothetical protein DEP04_06640 [Dehalococcoidia bacterium]|nr:hypothetical protein [Chloroflexota bacterium]HCE76290.1 hypothetical protein [Dehalococcoidia bacterium]